MLTALPRPVTEVLDSQLGMNLGARYTDPNGKEYIFLKGVASALLGSWVTYNESFVTVLATKAEIDKLKPLAVAQGAIVANKFGWFQVFGEVAAARVLASAAKEVAIYSSATAGSLDDDSTSQTKVNRAVLRATDGGSGGNVTAYIAYPSAG